MSLPTIALDRQLQIHDQFARGEFRGRLAEFLLDGPTLAGTTDKEWLWYADNIADAIGHAPTYAVTDLMMNVIEHGAETLGKQGVPLRLTEGLPSPRGFVWFESPRAWNVIGDRGVKHGPDTRKVSGVWWMAVDGVEIINEYGNKERVPGIMSGVVIAKEHLSRDTQEIMEVTGIGSYITFDIIGWAADRGWTIADTHDEYLADREAGRMGSVSPSGGHWRHWLLAFWALCEQWVEVLPTDRHARRRAQRGMPSGAPSWGDVRVISLRKRRIKRYDATGELVEWSHRWWVNGHWRWQACGPGRTQRRLIWVAPFIKGPDDKPLVMRDDVYVLRR